MRSEAKALVLAGGGAKGSYQVGVYRALREVGWLPDIITGISVGSLNGALFVMDHLDEAEQLWRTLDVHGVLEVPQGKKPEELRSFLLDVLRKGGLNIDPLGDTIDDYLDEEEMRSSAVRYGLVMTEMNTLRSHQYTLEEIPRGRLKEYMMASSACFPALRPQEIDGVKYIDGGWSDNMPMHLAARMGATELIAVDIDGVGINRPNTTGLPTRIIHSHWDLGPLFDFDGERAQRNIKLGYLDTLRMFGRVGGTAYAILPAEDTFPADFALAYRGALMDAAQRAPMLWLTESMARQVKGYPPTYDKDPTAPTAAALAPLEMAAERMQVPPDEPMTAKLLALTFLGSFDRDPADKFPILLGKQEGNVVGEAAMAAAAPEEFVTALVSHTLSGMGTGVFW